MQGGMGMQGRPGMQQQGYGQQQQGYGQQQQNQMGGFR